LYSNHITIMFEYRFRHCAGRAAIYILVFLFLHCSTHAQGKWQLQAAPVLCKTTFIDKSYSTTTFSGFIPGGALSLSYIKGGTTHQLDLLFTGGTLKTGTHPVYTASQKRIGVDYTNLYTIIAPGSSPLTVEAGGALNILYAGRTFHDFINSNTSFDLAASLGAAARLSLSFESSLPGFSLSDRVAMPLITWLVQPAYGNEDPSLYINQPGAHHRIAGPDGFLRLTNFLSLDKNFSSRQKLSLTYTWDYYRINAPQESREADHRLGLNYSLIL